MSSSDSQTFVYILQSQSSGRYYIGVTADLERRLTQHNAGYTTATRGSGPWEIVYAESYATRRAARRREAQLKRKKSHRYLAWLVDNE